MWPWLLVYGFGLLGVLFRGWWVVLLAAATWTGIAIFQWLNYGWYGHGWGEWGVGLIVLFACLTALAGAIGPAIRTGLRVARRFGAATEAPDGP
jgi:hypothetical protein